MRRCPECGCADVRYCRDGSWLAVVCGWCGLELHGIDVGVAR